MSLNSDIDELLDPLIASFSGGLQAELEGHLVTIYVAGDAQMVAWAGQPFEGPPIQGAIDFASKRSATLIKELDATTRERLRTTIANGIKNKRGIPGLARDIRSTFDSMSKYRSETIARTETANALGEAFMDGGNRMGVTGKEWITVGDAGVTPECEDNEFQGPIPMDAAFTSGPTHPPQHPNCLIPTVEVEVSHLVAGSRAWYEGDTIELRTAGGKYLRVTPQHMVLTTSGFVKAEALREGDYVVASSNTQGIMQTINPDYHDGPAQIAQVWHSLLMKPNMLRRIVPVAAEDFHGDAGRFNGNVDVVYPDGFLWSKVHDALVRKHVDEVHLGSRRTSDVELSRSCAPLQFGDGSDATRRSDVRSSRAGLALRRRHLCHRDKVGLASITGSDASFEEPPPDTVPVNPDGPTEGQFGLPGQIAGSQVDRRDLAARTRTDAVPLEEPVQGGLAYVELGQQFLTRFPGFVTLDKVTEVWNRYYRGHVYDLQSLESLYIASGIVVKNCRCALGPVML